MATVGPEAVRSRPLLVATPMYGGQCSGFYQKSMFELATVFARNGLRLELFSIFNESAVTRARNYCVHEFLRGDCTHLMFIDADIEFAPSDVLSMLALADPASNKDVVCGLYPKKYIRWDNVAAAAGRVPAEQLENFTGDLVLNPVGLTGSYDLHSPLEVAEIGTGFMMIQRRVFERFARHYPQAWYASDGREAKHHDERRRKILCCFENHIDPQSGRYLTEDYNFCRLVRQMGMKVWVAPWLNLNHVGHYKFIGNAAALSALADTAAHAA